MGWDADAIYDDRPFAYVDVEADPRAAEIFREAAAESIQAAGSTDAFLELASLDVSTCVEALAHYAHETNRVAHWNAERVRQLDATITWPDLATLPEKQRWPVASARAFLKACARGGYGIQFDL